MVTIVLLLKRKPGISVQQFREHYETSHALLGKKYFGHLFLDYRRQYVDSVVGPSGSGEQWVASHVDYDVVTRIVLKDAAAAAEFGRISRLPEVFAELKADEERFLDRSAIRILHCDDVRTWTAGEVESALLRASS